MSGNPAQNAMIRGTIYDLKQRFGAPASVYRLDSAATDYETGAKTASKTAYPIDQMIILPATEARRFFATISYIGSAKSFVSPGQQGWDQGKRAFVIAGDDLRDFEFEPEDWIVYRNKRYDIEMIDVLEYDAGWFIMAKEIKGQVPQQIIYVNATTTLEIEQEAEDS
jgi:hypothetical protein